MLMILSPTVFAKTMFGVGSSTCGAWSRERELQRQGSPTPALVGMQAWGTGYLTAMNQIAGDDILKDIDPEAAFAWVDNYCGAHPLEQLARANAALLKELVSRADRPAARSTRPAPRSTDHREP